MRRNSRNGFRRCRFDTCVGTIALQIPKVRETTYVPLVLTHRQRAEMALISVVQRTAVHGISTRKIEVLTQELGVKILDKSTVSRMCTALDESIHTLRNELNHISHRDKRAIAALCRTMVAQTTQADAQR